MKQGVPWQIMTISSSGTMKLSFAGAALAFLNKKRTPRKAAQTQKWVSLRKNLSQEWYLSPINKAGACTSFCTCPCFNWYEKLLLAVSLTDRQPHLRLRHERFHPHSPLWPRVQPPNPE